MWRVVCDTCGKEVETKGKRGLPEGWSIVKPKFAGKPIYSAKPQHLCDEHGGIERHDQNISGSQ